MADLIAQGADSHDRWRRALPTAREVVLGRAAAGWATPWDEHISRRHAGISWRGDRLYVRLLSGARNPIFFKGQNVDRFDLGAGEHFVIGGTTFTVADERVNVSLDVPLPARQQTFTSKYLQEVQFRHAEAQIEVLSRLPEVISGSASDTELYPRMINLLLAGIPRAGAAALVAIHSGVSAARDDEKHRSIEVLHWDRRLVTGDDFQPSERLISEAIEKKQSLLHVWSASDSSTTQAFTVRQGIDWAFCTPIGGKACQGWGIYVAGRFHADEAAPHESSDPSDLRDDLKFTEIAAAALSSLREVRMLERQRAGLTQFFSPIVLEALANEDPDVVLAPRETEVTVLFCDLRGFARRSEQSAGDLHGLLQRVSDALGVTTHAIREQGGVLGDFHGDAAMGFWGWPLAQPDAALRACLAAVAIRSEFAAAARRPDDPLADFRVGIGVATGRAVAGKIGTTDQVKVTAFGPVVNLASRLEGMTKPLHAPILLDALTAAQARSHLPAEAGQLRRVAVVRPYGLENALEVVELLPPAAERQGFSDIDVAEYEQALDDFIAGRWTEAIERLRNVPSQDRVKDFLTVYMAERGRTPPDDWNGVVAMTSK